MVFVIVALFWLLQLSIVTLRRASSSPYQRLGSLIAQRIKSSFVRRSWHSLGSLKAAAPSLMQSEASAWKPENPGAHLSLAAKLLLSAIAVTFYYYESEVSGKQKLLRGRSSRMRRG